MAGVQGLPPELWRIIIRYATTADRPVDIAKEYCRLGFESEQEPLCLKDDTPLTPIHYHRRPIPSQSAVESFTQSGLKRSIALVCRTFNNLVQEYIFEKLYISEAKAANKLAETLENSELYENAGRWTSHITIVGVFFTYPPTSGELASATVRILSRTPHLQSFHLTWNSTTREFRERERMMIDAISTRELRRFEWDCTGGGFERQQDHPFYRLVSSARSTLHVLKLSGYLPLAELPMPLSPQSQESSQVQNNNDNVNNVVLPSSGAFPYLTHLKIRRAFRDDLLFISQWSISSSLTCLSLGSIWAYFDSHELAFSFFDTPKPCLRCLHLGEGSNVSPALAHRILRSADNLRVLEYFYLGEWERDTWIGVTHERLEVVKVHVSHPVIALRSLFNSRRFSRDQQWEKILRHISPFLGCFEYAYHQYQEEDQQRQQQAQSQGRTVSDSFGSVEPMTRTWYPSMKSVVFLEYTRYNEDLQYEPAELAEWLRTTIAQIDMKTDVQLKVEIEDYIR